MESGIFEDQGAAITEGDFLRLPRGPLVEVVWIRTRWIPRTVEPVEIRFVVRNPFLDGLPRRLDGLHRVDVEGRWWRAGKLDDSLPQAVEAEEKLDLVGADEGANGAHGAFATGTFERIATPDLED